MATTKIMTIKQSKSGSPGKHLAISIDYICAPEKTQNGLNVGGHNVIPQTAYVEMMETKRRFDKTDKRQAYHLVISFQENEMTPQAAFSFAGEFAKRYFGNEYEAVYAVHDNTAHTHIHLVFNSINLITGKKFHYKKGDWEKKIQPLVNELCEQFGISVLDIHLNDPDEGPVSWAEHQEDKMLWSDMIRRDIDNSILVSEEFEDFLKSMRDKGYEIKQGKYLAVKPPGMQRFRRCKTLGKEYEEEAIRQRVMVENISNQKQLSFEETERIVYTYIPRGKRANLTKLQKQYYAKLYRLGLIKQRPYSKAWKYKEELRELTKYQEKYLFLLDYDIQDVTQLQHELENLSESKKKISNEKSRVYKANKKNAELFEILEEMESIKSMADTYLTGNEDFAEEYALWQRLEQKLQVQGYSYEEVHSLREHYKMEMARMRGLEKETKNHLYLAKTILEEVNNEQQTLSKEQERQVKQPKR